MPRRNHTERTRGRFDSFQSFHNLEEELRRSWRMWQQAAAERAQAREQQRRIDQFRRQYTPGGNR